MAKIKVYGFERFLLDVGAETIDKRNGYELLAWKIPGDRRAWRENNIIALKMTCPSTGAVYISPVDPMLRTVPEALDWYFQTEDYLGRISVQT